MPRGADVPKKLDLVFVTIALQLKVLLTDFHLEKSDHIEGGKFKGKKETTPEYEKV